jgi:Na+-driven multidrug efflux pump
MMLFSLSIGLATEILIGRLVGAGRFEDAYTECMRSLRIGLIVTMGVAAVFAALAPWILGLFTEDPAIIATGTLLLRMGLLLEPARAFNLIVINSLRATGDARFPLYAGLLSQWCVMALGGWLLGTWFGFGLVGVWCAFLIDEWFRGLAMLHRWKKRRWLKYAVRMRAEAAA